MPCAPRDPRITVYLLGGDGTPLAMRSATLTGMPSDVLLRQAQKQDGVVIIAGAATPRGLLAAQLMELARELKRDEIPPLRA